MSNKKNGLIVLLFFLIVLIGFATYFSSNNTTRMGETFVDESHKANIQKVDEREDSSESNGENDANKKAQKRAEGLKLFLEEPYFRLPTISVPAIKSNKLRGFLHIRIVIKVDDKKAFTIAKLLIPRINDAIFVDLFKAFNLLWYPKYDPSPSVIQKRIIKACQKVLGEKGINAVLIQEFFFTRFFG